MYRVTLENSEPFNYKFKSTALAKFGSALSISNIVTLTYCSDECLENAGFYTSEAQRITSTDKIICDYCRQRLIKRF